MSNSKAHSGSLWKSQREASQKSLHRGHDSGWVSHQPGQHQWPLPHGGEHRDVQNDVSTAGESLDQHLTQVGLSQEEIRLVTSSPYHQFVSLGAQACR